MMSEQRTNNRKRVGVVSTDPLRVLGLTSILEEGSNFEAIPLTGPGALKTEGLGIVLIDESATEYLFELIEGFRRERPNLRLMVMGPEPNQEHVEQVIAAGARGYLSYSASEHEVRTALQSVDEGSVWASRRVLARLLDRPSRSAQRVAIHEVPKFTPREREVLQLLVMGYPNRNIGQALGVDEGTVKAHVGRLMRKVGVVNRTALTMTTLERHLC
jgi:DNA-binding NarL/FixJ family response regulator